MSLSDKEFDELLNALRRNPESKTIAEAAAAAADTSLRRTLLKAFRHSPPAGDAINAIGAGESADASDDPGEDGHEGEAIDKSPASSAPDHDPKVIDIKQRRERTGHAFVGPAGLDDVGGLEAVKKQLRRKMLDPLKHPGVFQRFKRRSGGGLLLYGPPGCGKTMIVRAVAREADIRLIQVEAAEILDFAVGISEKKIAAAFAEARTSKPCILFFDEVEALAGRRSAGSDFKSGLVSSFLSAFDGLTEHGNGILVVAATNTPWAVDGAFRRPGRFDRTLFVPPPDRTARETILKSLLGQRPARDDVRVGDLAAATSGFSGADLVNLIETAVDLAIEECIRRDGDERLEMRHLLSAIEEVQPTTAEWLATARNYAKYANEGGAYKEVLTFLDRHAA